LARGEIGPLHWAVLVRKGQTSRSAGAANLFEQFFARGADHYWIAPDAG
jgi:hypothetical protein